jgi:hypothetical protein
MIGEWMEYIVAALLYANITWVLLSLRLNVTWESLQI